MTDQIRPVPTEQEAVAIAAAMQELWPRPLVTEDYGNPLRAPTWRFSGRWWSRPLPHRRDRPFR